MILDNENNNKKVHEWISEYTEEGTFDIVTGYFTIGALAWLSNDVNHKISKFRMVLGDIVNFDVESNRPLDLLNENISIEAALKLNKLSQEAVDKSMFCRPRLFFRLCRYFNPSTAYLLFIFVFLESVPDSPKSLLFFAVVNKIP